MILIFSTSQDPSTLDVMRWIHHLSDARVVRINSDETHAVTLRLRDDDYHLDVDGEQFCLADVSSAWLRKGDFWFKGLFPALPPSEQSALPGHINQRLQREDRVLRDHFHHVLRRRCAVLGNAHASAPNKLIVLDLARSLGLSTPSFEVSTLRRDAQELVASGRPWATKAMSDGIYLFDVEHSRAGYFSYTELLDADMLDGLGEHMSPSFFQQYIDKSIELRVFFLDEFFVAAAIFSQDDEQTRVDYRKYNLVRPNRVVPYRLPAEVQRKLSALARALELDTGSMDLIVDREGRHHFLEVNPVGQFGPMSEGCNQAIERRIAERLVCHES